MLDLDEIIKCTNVHLAVKDKNSKYIYCNEKYAQLLDMDAPKQIIGKCDYDFFPNQTANMCRAGDNFVLAGKALLNAPEKIVCRKKTIDILTAKSQAKNKNGNIVGVVLSFVDVTNINYKLTSNILKYNRKKHLYEFKIGKNIEYFTIREHDVFKKVFLGLSAKQIAQQLSISPRTVEYYIEKIKLKLQCGYKSNIIEAAIRYGIIQQNIW